MFFRNIAMMPKRNIDEQIKKIKTELETADAVVIGAGAGLSTSAGFRYDGERFEAHFSDFRKAYGIEDMYSGGFYPYDTLEEYWAWWSRHIWINRYDCPVGQVYKDLLETVKDKDYFVLTTNVDHQFQRAGFDKHRLFYTQGDYGLWQCSKACHDQTYDNEECVREMIEQQKDMKIPSGLIPRCPVCGAPMTMNLRCDDTFVEDKGWHQAAGRYDDFIRRHKGMHVVYLELGVGMNTPGIIKYPFWQMTAGNADATYICINQGQAMCPQGIEGQSVCVDVDISEMLKKIVKAK